MLQRLLIKVFQTSSLILCVLGNKYNCPNFSEGLYILGSRNNFLHLCGGLLSLRKR